MNNKRITCTAISLFVREFPFVQWM